MNRSIEIIVAPTGEIRIDAVNFKVVRLFV